MRRWVAARAWGQLPGGGHWAEGAGTRPRAARAGAMDKQIETARANTLLLDRLRGNSKRDMDVLAAMTGLMPFSGFMVHLWPRELADERKTRATGLSKKP